MRQKEPGGAMTKQAPLRTAHHIRWRGFSNLHRALCGLLAVLQLLLPSLVAALPTDGHVAGGSATVQQTNPNTLNVVQASERAILNWKSFSIAADEAVHFVQPSANSIALNRVVGTDPSVILGRLQSNGRLFLLNPNGILFGAGAQINVGGLLATTLQIRDEDFMAGRYLFAQDPLKELRSVVNRGTIHVSEHGYAFLVAPGVSNEGLIVANLGSVVLGSGRALTVDLMGDGLINYALGGKVLDQVKGPDGMPLRSAVSNSGTVQADGGHIVLSAKAAGDIFSSVVNQSGIVRARSLTNENGIVRLDGGDSGVVQMAGTIDASGLSTGETGGQISVLGQRVALLDGAKVEVSGDKGGGTVLLGGNYQGRGPEPNAERTLVQSGATIAADAHTSGDGGTVIVWADGDTRFAGGISARGGAESGNGGFVEVSGKQDLDFRGAVDVAAPNGTGGRVLLDPQDIVLNTSAQPAPPNNPNGTPDVAFADPPDPGTSTIQIADVTGFSELFLQATRNITVANPITMGAGNSIRLEANNNITLNTGANMAVSGVGSIRLAADADASGAGALTLNNARLTSQQGGIQLSGAGITGTGAITTTGAANQNGGSLVVTSTGAVSLGAITANGGTASAGNPGRAGGAVSITGATGVSTGAVTANGSNGSGANQQGGAGGSISITKTTSGNLTTGNLAASGGNAGTGTANGGNGGTISLSNAGAGNVTLGTLTARTGNAIGTGSSTAGSVSVTSTVNGGTVQTNAINTTGGNNGAGGNITLSSNGALQFVAGSTIQANGGTARPGTVGRTGGAVSLSGATVNRNGAITASGSNGNGANQSGGNAGSVSITSNGALTATGTITASGGNAGGGNAAAGNGGAITITNNSLTTGNVTTGALTARTGNAAGTGSAGAAGSISATQSNATSGATLQTGAINTSGGTKGGGGAVTLNSSSNVNVTSTITTSGGAAVAGGTHIGAAAGNVTITGVNRTVSGTITASGGAAVGTNQAGGNAAIVSSTGTGTTTTGTVNARTGAATGTGVGGAQGSVTLTGTTVSSGAINTSGLANGNGGNVTVTSSAGATTLSTVTTSGGTANANTAGRNAGTVNVTSAGNITVSTITASGSNANGGNLTGGNGGAVTFDAGGGAPTITHQNITTTGGNRSGSGTAGTGGNINVVDGALLAANSTLTATGGSAGLGAGGNVTFGSTVNGNAAGRTLTVNTNGVTTFTGHVGGTTALGSLTSNATGSVQIGGNVTTTGSQNYSDPVTLLGHSILTGTTPTFGSTVNGGGFDLTLNFSGTTTINGATFTNINNFTSGNGGTTNVTGAFATIGTQTYNDAVALTGATTLTSSGNQAITFNSTINGAQTLAINTTGTATFTGAVGGTTALASLTTNTGGTTAINGGAVTTSGNQIYNDNVTMSQATTLTSTGGAVTFGSNATNTAASAAITVNAPTINLTGGTTVATTGNGQINFFANTLNPNGAGINAGTGTFALAPNTLTHTIEFGDVNTARATDVYYGSNFGTVTAGSFTIGRSAHTGNIFVTGVASAPAPITFVNGGTGSVTFENAAYVSGNRNLGVVGGSGGVSIGSNLSLGTGALRLTTAGTITQTAGAITATTAGLSAATGIMLTQPANDMTTLAAQTTAGSLSFTDTNGFSIGSVGATVDGFHPAITGLAANAGTITLQSGGAVTQSARLLASTLNLQGTGPYTLTNGANDITTLTANSTGNVQYTDAGALVLGASTVGGTLIVTTGGAITQSGAVTITGATTLAAGANDITLTNAGNNFSSVGISSGSTISLTDANALTLNASNVSGAFTANAADLTVGGAVSSTGGAVNLTAANSIAQSANLSSAGANNVVVTATGGAITMAATATTTSGTGTINYTAGTDVTLGSLSTGGGVNVAANGGSVLSAAGSGTNVTAGANSSLQAFNGVVGTQANPLTVNVNPGTLSIRATTAVAGISAFLTGTVLPGNALTLLNAPPGLVCFNGCPVSPSTNPFGGFFGLIPSINKESILPPYTPESSAPPLISIVSTYVPGTVVAEAETDVRSDEQSVAREIPPCFPASACKPGATLLAAPANGLDETVNAR